MKIYYRLKGNFYLELQENRLAEQTAANQGLLRIAKELSLPIVATNDVHYLSRPMAASRNHGNRSNDTNSSRSATSSQKPRRDTLVTSTAEVRFPSRADVILVLRDRRAHR